jgi:hypothetical protein
MTYQCVTCRTIFDNPVFEIVREWERVDYAEVMPCFEIESSEAIECYCSSTCMDARTPEVMKREDTPIRRPGIGPIELCARCQGVVDMSHFHLTYLKSKGVWKDGEFDTPEIDYLAVLCRSCAPGSSGKVVKIVAKAGDVR